MAGGGGGRARQPTGSSSERRWTCLTTGCSKALQTLLQTLFHHTRVHPSTVAHPVKLPASASYTTRCPTATCHAVARTSRPTSACPRCLSSLTDDARLAVLGQGHCSLR